MLFPQYTVFTFGDLTMTQIEAHIRGHRSVERKKEGIVEYSSGMPALPGGKIVPLKPKFKDKK